MKKIALGILTFIWIWFWINFAQSLPDSAKIEVKDPIQMWEAVNLKITMLKNNSPMTSYDGTVRINIVDENWMILTSNDYTIPSNGIYTFKPENRWEIEFQKWLEIKKEWTFYIEVENLDLNDDDDIIFWEQVIHVTSDTPEPDTKNIDIFYPTNNLSLIWNKIDIIASVDIPNSEAIVYIDGNQVWKANVLFDGSINTSIGDVSEWPHNLSIQIFDTDWKIMWKSDIISFNMTSSLDWEIKDVTIEPNDLLIVWDSPEITIHTDEIVESVKMRLSDRPDNEAMTISKIWMWTFSQKFFLITWWDISLSFDIYAVNNTIHKSYDNYTGIKVLNEPIISWIVISSSLNKQVVNIAWETVNDSIVSWYLINWRIDGSNSSSWSERTEKKNFNFPNSLPYDTDINVNITPYRDKDISSTKHWAASKTVKFVISKENSCGNSICENWEDYTSCPQDCPLPSVVVTLWPSCPAQQVSVHTTKIWNSYYLIRDKAENVTKYNIYTSAYPDWKDKVKVYETTDTCYEYPFDDTADEEIYVNFRIVWICENWDEIELSWATKVQVWPSENFILLLCVTFLVYAGIKLFRQTEE